MDKFVNCSMNHGGDPGSYFMEQTLARYELEKMSELMSDCRFKEIRVQGSTAEYKDIKIMMCRDSTLDTGQLHSTMRHL